MARVEYINDGIMRLHGPSGAYHDFDPYGSAEVATIIQPKKGKNGLRVSVSLGGRTKIYPVNTIGEATAFAKEVVNIIRNFPV
jgi:hypothetical protein